MAMDVSGISGSTGGNFVNGGPGQAKSLVEATLQENAKQQAINRAPLKIPDATIMNDIGNNIHIYA